MSERRRLEGKIDVDVSGIGFSIYFGLFVLGAAIYSGCKVIAVAIEGLR